MGVFDKLEEHLFPETEDGATVVERTEDSVHFAVDDMECKVEVCGDREGTWADIEFLNDCPPNVRFIFETESNMIEISLDDYWIKKMSIDTDNSTDQILLMNILKEMYDMLKKQIQTNK